MSTITFGTVCTGIGAPEVAWAPLGWHCSWQAEIENNPSRILAHHWPTVPNLGDMTALPGYVRNKWIAAVDILCGGTPCQAYSIAGLRGGMADPRGQLTLTFVDLANAIDEQREPGDECVVVWENVPGVLSSADNAFGYFLAGLAGESDPLVSPGGKWANAGLVIGPQRVVAWRIVDAQYFGVAQRRRRVLVVASARNGFDPAAILFEFGSVRRDSPPRRGAQEEIAGTLTSSLGVRRGAPDCGSTPGHLQPVDVSGKAAGSATQQDAHSDLLVPVLSFKPRIARNGRGDMGDLCSALTALGGDAGGRTDTAPHVAYAIQAGALRTNPDSGPDGIGVQADHAYTLEARAEVQAVAYPVCVTGDITHSLKAEGFDASEDGTGRGQPIVPTYAFDARQDCVSSTEVFGALSTSSPQAQAIAYTVCLGSDPLHARDIAMPITTRNGDPGVVAYQHAAPGIVWRVRRLTPTECERLQGFPTVKETVIVELCSDPQKNYAHAVLQCHRSLSNAWPVVESESTLFANAAAPNSSTPPADPVQHVVLRVLTHSGGDRLQILNHEKCLWSANTAASCDKSPLSMQTVATAVALARLSRELAHLARSGGVGLQTSVGFSMAGNPGVTNAPKCGDENAACANDATSGAKPAKSITSKLTPPIPLVDSTQATLLCSVLAAIDSCIPNETLPANFSLRIDIETQFTAIPGMKDGPRYKALGNSMCVFKMRWLGARIAPYVDAAVNNGLLLPKINQAQP